MMALIQKSVRLPEDVIAYIDKLPGDTFTDRLLSLLEFVKKDGVYNRLYDEKEHLKDVNRHLEEKIRVFKATAYSLVDILDD